MPSGAPPSHTLAGVLSRIQGGQRSSDQDLSRRLNEAFSKHEDALKRYCTKELRGFPAEGVEEVAQEVLMEAWNKLPGYRPEESFRAFLWGIASRKCANARRKRHETPSEDGFLDTDSEERSILARLADQERDLLVDQASQSVLSRTEQEVVHLRWVLDYPYEDVARLAGLASSDEVRVVLQRCKRRLSTEVRRLLLERGAGESFLATGQR